MSRFFSEAPLWFRNRPGDVKEQGISDEMEVAYHIDIMTVKAALTPGLLRL